MGAARSSAARWVVTAALNPTLHSALNESFHLPHLFTLLLLLLPPSSPPSSLSSITINLSFFLSYSGDGASKRILKWYPSGSDPETDLDARDPAAGAGWDARGASDGFLFCCCGVVSVVEMPRGNRNGPGSEMEEAEWISLRLCGRILAESLGKFENDP